MAILMASLSALVISVILIVEYFLFIDTAFSGVQHLVPCTHICATHLLTTTTAHAQGLLVLSCPNESPLMQLFYLANKRLMKLAVTQV